MIYVNHHPQANDPILYTLPNSYAHAQHNNLHNVYIIYSRDTASADSNHVFCQSKIHVNATNDDTFANQLKKEALKNFPDVFPETLPK